MLKALANEDTLLPTQMFPRLPARITFVADTTFVSRTRKMFLILFRNILCPQQMFSSLCSPRNIMSNNESATMCPRLPVPLHYFLATIVVHYKCASTWRFHIGLCEFLRNIFMNICSVEKYTNLKLGEHFLNF